MSNYYSMIKKKISKDYELLSWGDIGIYYLIMFVGFVSVIGFFRESQNYVQSEASAFVYLILGIGSYFVSKLWRDKIAKERWEKTRILSQDTILNFNSINSLIDELEKNLSSLKTVSQWAVGVLTTLIVLISTLMGNVIFKFIDVVLKVLKDDDIQKLSDMFVEEYNNSGSSMFEIIFGGAGNLLLICVFPIALGYLVFSTLSFIRKRVLGILYDVRYHFLISEKKEDDTI